MNIKNAAELKEKLLHFCESIDFSALAKDVEPFLFFSKDAKKIVLFNSVIRNLSV